MQRLQVIARNTVGLLVTMGILALLACGAETWRYVLLVRSRNSALHADVVGASDALVVIVALLTFVFGLGAFAITVWWLMVARGAAEEASGQAPPRPMWQALLGVLCPGLNLVMAGSIVAELEHAAAAEPATRRPRPSRLVLGWWAVWAVNGVLLAVTIVRRFGDSVQAQADAVLLNALLNASAAVLAVLSALVVRRMTQLLVPVESMTLRRMRVLGVSGAPEPTRRQRPATATR